MILYFTGTGNSYAIAKQIGNRIGDEQVFPIVDFNDYALLEKIEHIGFVFPSYGGNAPDIVLKLKDEILNKVDKSQKYIFAVTSFASTPMGAYYAFTNDVDAWFEVKMPSGGVVLSNSTPQIQSEKILSDATILINKFANGISNKDKIIMYKPMLAKKFLSKVSHNITHRTLKYLWSKFYVDESCIKCEACTKICPVHNIYFDSQVRWGSNCAYCMGCINRCPQQAIQIGEKTKKKARYCHPDIK